MLSRDNHLYEFEPFSLDAANRILLKDGVIVHLTPKALETLLVLVQRRVQVVEKDLLLKEIWPDSFVEEGSLSRNIHELRKALGDDSAEPRYIATIPKRGYRFIAPVRVIAKDDRPMTITGVEGDTTVIEKHTFARVISKEIEGSDDLFGDLQSSTTANPEHLALPGVSEQRVQSKSSALVIGVLLLVAAIGLVFYVTVAQKSAERKQVAPVETSRAKTTLVRLTNNNAMDGAPNWSPDGSKIAFWSNRDGKNEIYVMDSDGSNVKRLTNNMSDDGNPTWSPDGRKILFDSDRDGNLEIYVMDADGTNQTRLTRNNATDSATSWSPDGSKIAFASNRDNSYPHNFDIYVMEADGSNVKKIVDDPEYDAEPRWSPDGRKILFVTRRNDHFDVYEANADGTGQRNVTADYNQGSGSGTWSRNGKRIAFVRYLNNKNQIFVMDAEGGNLKNVTNNFANNSRPSWSPDGSKLALETDRDGNLEIYSMSVDGELLQLTDNPAEDGSPDWSPDGSKIAFQSNRGGKQHIFKVNADGTLLSQLTNSEGDDAEPCWSPDGDRIAFASTRDGNKEIYVMNADGSNQSRLTVEPGSDFNPRWSPTGRILFTSNREGQPDLYVMYADGKNVSRLTKMTAGQGSWSPDGTKVVFIAHSLEEMKGQSELQKRVAGGRPLEVFIMDSDGSNVRMLTKSLTSTGVPCWSRDGASIAFFIDSLDESGNIFQIDVDGGNLRRVTAGPRFDSRPAFSADGSKMAFQSNRDGNYEIYIMNVR